MIFYSLCLFTSTFESVNKMPIRVDGDEINTRGQVQKKNGQRVFNNGIPVLICVLFVVNLHFGVLRRG